MFSVVVLFMMSHLTESSAAPWGAPSLFLSISRWLSLVVVHTAVLLSKLRQKTQ